jgi:hypothetical protein
MKNPVPSWCSLLMQLGAQRLGLGPSERRQQHGREDGDNGDDHQQFD